jgi:hypothetical protein
MDGAVPRQKPKALAGVLPQAKLLSYTTGRDACCVAPLKWALFGLILSLSLSLSLYYMEEKTKTVTPTL